MAFSVHTHDGRRTLVQRPDEAGDTRQPYRRSERLRSRGRGGRGGARPRVYGHLVLMTGMAAILAALAFFLLPTGHVSTYGLIQVNGLTCPIPAGLEVSSLSQVSGLLARPGSTLDLTGDVISIGEGSPATREMDGKPFSEALTLGEGALVSVRHGEHVLEALREITQDIPFESTVTGQGNIVTLVQTGAPGVREIYKGVSSGKQAANLVARAPKDVILERTSEAKAGQKLAALTFDDGPGTHTQAVLDALAAAHVPATFFVLGSSAAGNKGIIAEMKAAGHEVENHTWNHPNLTKVSAAEFRSQVSRTSAVIGGARFLRPPYGSSNASVRAQAAAMGIRLAFWTVDTLDWKNQDVDSILGYVKSQARPGAIILMHDGGQNRSQTVAALPVVVDWLFSQGYSLTVVDQIL